MVTVSVLLHVRNKVGSHLFYLLFGVAREFRNQHRGRITFDKETVVSLFPVVLRAVENRLVHQLYSAWPIFQCDQVGLEGIVKVIQMYDDDGLLFRRKRVAMQFYLGKKCESAFGTGQQFAEVKRFSVACKRIRLQEQIDTVPGIASPVRL